MAGGDGVGGLSSIVSAVADRLSEPGPNTEETQLIVVCGSNKTVFADLTNLGRCWPVGIKVEFDTPGIHICFCM